MKGTRAETGREVALLYEMYSKGMQDTAVRDAERSGPALMLVAWTQSMVVRSGRLSEAKMRKPKT